MKAVRMHESGGVDKLIYSGQIRAVVDRVYPLSEAQAAVRQLAGRDVFGKIVVVP